MGTRKIIKSKKSNKGFRETRSKRQRGIVGGKKIKPADKKKHKTRKRKNVKRKRDTYRYGFPQMIEVKEEEEEEIPTLSSLSSQ